MDFVRGPAGCAGPGSMDDLARSPATAAPYWNDYRSLLASALDGSFPDTTRLNALLPPQAASGSGRPLRFVPAGAIPGVAYERRVYETGQVSTRDGSWHDLFNALVWCRLPCFKAAMNALHYARLEQEREGRRGALRDALTLLDESGALVLARHPGLLQALAARDWRCAFRELRPVWRAGVRVVVCGHGLLDKLRAPYRSVTAHALLLSVRSTDAALAGDGFLHWLDRELGDRMNTGLCATPADLSPLPLAGIPGWWADSDQDRAFYDDLRVFRPPPAGALPAPVHSL